MQSIAENQSAAQKAAHKLSEEKTPNVSTVTRASQGIQHHSTFKDDQS